MQGPASQSLELLEAVQDVAGLVARLGGHLPQLAHVAVADAEGEDLHPLLPQAPRFRPGVAAVGEAVGDEEDGLDRVPAGRAEHFLPATRIRGARVNGMR